MIAGGEGPRRGGGLGAALVLLVVGTGCESPSPEELAPAWSEGPDLVLTRAPLPPELEREVLFQVRGLAVVHPAPGPPVVALADAGNHRLLFWHPSEGRIETFGRQGEGPGEFGRIQGLWAVDDIFLIEDGGNNRYAFVDPRGGEVGTSPRDVVNLVGGGAVLDDRYLAAPAFSPASEPFVFRRIIEDEGRWALEEAERPEWFPDVAGLEVPLHPLYEEVGLAFPEGPSEVTDLAVPLGQRLLWIQPRRGHVVLLPLDRPGSEARPDEGEGPEGSALETVEIPEAVMGEHLRAWVDSRGEAGMREQHFPPFWASRPDLRGERVLLPVPFATGDDGDPLGWYLQLRDDGGVEGRIVRLAPGESLADPPRAVLPLPDGRFLLGHEGGVTLLAPHDESGSHAAAPSNAGDRTRTGGQSLRGPPDAALAGDSANLEARQQAFLAALGARDAEAVAEYFAADGVLQIANMPPVEGRDRIRELYRNLFNFMETGEVTAERLQIAASGDLAYSLGGTRNAFRTEEGLAEYVGKYLLVWEMRGDEWFVVVYSVSSNAPGESGS